MRIHKYHRDEQGLITHNTGTDQDYGGTIGTDGVVQPLVGWQTPGMCQAVSSNGDYYAWFIGTDEHGKKVPAE